MVAGSDRADTIADRLDDSSSFVPEDRGERDRVILGSVWQTPVATTRIRTSSERGSEIRTFSMTNCAPLARTIAARADVTD
jgi:hypothetical protein